jgi:hypothetical protein
MKPVTIDLQKHHVDTILLALEVLQRLHLGQFRMALETAFKKKSMKFGWDKLAELERPLKEAYFPEYPGNSGPGICGDITQEAKVAFEIQNLLELCLALRETEEFDALAPVLTPSGLPLPVIEEVKEETTTPLRRRASSGRRLSELKAYTSFPPLPPE